MKHDHTYRENMMSSMTSVPVRELIVSCIIHVCIVALPLFVWIAPVKDYRISALTVHLFCATNRGSTEGDQSREVSPVLKINEEEKRPVERAEKQNSDVEKESKRVVVVPDPQPEKSVLSIDEKITDEAAREDPGLAGPETGSSIIEGSAAHMEQPIGLHDGEVQEEVGTGHPGAVERAIVDGQIMDAAFGEGNGPHFMIRVEPVYPLMARRLGKEGRVLLRLLIDGMGRLMEVEVVERAGFGFERAAVDAVRRSSFRPAFRNGRSVTSRSLLAVKFVLKDG